MGWAPTCRRLGERQLSGSEEPHAHRAPSPLLLPNFFPDPEQEFLKVFEQLRDEIVNDELLAGQPDSSKAWVREVSAQVGVWEGGA